VRPAHSIELFVWPVTVKRFPSLR